jgi:hypothetical protein
MPRLIEYVTIGICSGYGDGDYRVSCSVEGLSVAQMKELRQAFCGALFTAEEMWRNARVKDPENQAKQASPSCENSDPSRSDIREQ